MAKTWSSTGQGFEGKRSKPGTRVQVKGYQLRYPLEITVRLIHVVPSTNLPARARLEFTSTDGLVWQHDLAEDEMVTLLVND